MVTVARMWRPRPEKARVRWRPGTGLALGRFVIKGARMASTATSYGIWLTFPRAEEAFGKFGSYFGVSYGLWARYRDSPLWLSFSNPPADLRRTLEPLQHKDPPELIESGNRLRIPIELPVGKERGEVLDAVVDRLLAIARPITPER